MATLRLAQRRAREAQVLDAASSLFAEQGYQATHVEEIAARAAVAPATVYKYFETKPNLVRSLAVRHLRQALPERRAVVARASDDPLEAVLALEDLLVEQSVRVIPRDCWAVILSAAFLDPGGPFDRTMGRLTRLIILQHRAMLTRSQAAGRLADDIDVRALATLVWSIGNLHFQRYIRDAAFGEDGVKAAIRRDLDLIFRGLRRGT
ncbi:TetR/AcrR family transcriptional regulator [Zavarzinia sp. CC-PAN008]|uniref:TetR/AcrR family transcriptional regulator n=1 Tax=Zavarzinia sp. CC-PAN008 TaxID=3243332 RepID=UPI003F744983